MNEYKKQWYLNNKDRLLKKAKKYREKNLILLREKQNAYAKNNPDKLKQWQIANTAHIKEYKKKYKETHKNQRNTAKREREKFDHLFKITNSIRRTISMSLSKRGYSKQTQTYQILGCTYEEFKIYLEQQFKPWMNWDNYGNKNGIAIRTEFSWDIDHIIPLRTAKTESDIIRLNHYTNLHPLDSYINRNIKNGNYDHPSLIK